MAVLHHQPSFLDGQQSALVGAHGLHHPDEQAAHDLARVEGAGHVGHHLDAVLEALGELAVERAHPLLGTFALGDVAADHGRDDVAAETLLGGRQLGREGGSILAQSLGLEGILAPDRDAVWDQALDAFPQHVGGRAAEDALGALVEERQAAFAVEAEDAVRRQVEDALEPGFGLGPAPLRGLQLAPGLAQLHLAQLLGLPAHGLGLVEELDEDPHLGPQRMGLVGLEDEVGRAQLVAGLDVRLGAVEGRHEDDRHVLGVGPGSDQPGGLEAVQVAHAHVQQDQGEVLLEELAEGLPARPRADQPLAEGRQDAFQRDQVGRCVVYQQDGGRGDRFQVQVRSTAPAVQRRSSSISCSASTGLAM